MRPMQRHREAQRAQGWAYRSAEGRGPTDPRAFLQEGWVIANHILVSFHVAFISSVLALPAESVLKADVLRFIFLSPDTLVSAVFMYVSFHLGIAIHELGHFLTAARLTALNEAVMARVKPRLESSLPRRLGFYAGLVLRIPYGSAVGVKREGLNYYPDAPYNLAVTAAGPRASRNAAAAALPPAAALIALGLLRDVPEALYAGRLLLGVGVVTVLDFLLADPGKYAEFRNRERAAQEQAGSVAQVSGWGDTAREMKARMLGERTQRSTHPRLGPVTAPWQFRNCGMGGRHTEKEYPESNVSMQEAMFLILSARNYQDAQELTVRLQNRLKEIIEKEEGCRVMGIGLEGGLAPYIEKGSYPLPEVRLWSMMKQAIAECGCRPGMDVAIALDPALSELEIAYREEFNVPDAVGMYLFWRDKAKTVLDRDSVLDIYTQAIEKYEIPVLSIEDGFSENDAAGWKLLLDKLGDSTFVIGDDLVTTNDRTIETSAAEGLINCALIKANQIGSLYETILAMLVALGKGLELVVSHRSKSPNDDMEAQIALAANALGLKAGGGANTERLVKYQAVTELMLKVEESNEGSMLRAGERAVIKTIRAYEEPTNAGIPTVGATVELQLPESGVILRFKGATPLGTSAGAGEAIHLVDSQIERAEHKEVIDRYAALFEEIEPGTYSFKKGVDQARVQSTGDDAVERIFARAQRYKGKGCLNAVDNVLQIITPCFQGKDAVELGLKDIDRALLGLELDMAVRRRKLDADAPAEERIRVMQRKQNLGMNAMLSASLGLARAVAHVQGKELYELLREEMMSIVERLAAANEVPIEGSRFEDYVAAVRMVNEKIEGRGETLYGALRDLTGIYAVSGTGPTKSTKPSRSTRAGTSPPRAGSADRRPAPAEGIEASEKRGKPSPPADAAGDHLAKAPARTAPASSVEAAPSALEKVPRSVQPLRRLAHQSLRESDRTSMSALNQVLHAASASAESADRWKDALATYQSTKRQIGSHLGRFGIVNNRIFKSDGQLLVPYLGGDTVFLQQVRQGKAEEVAARRFPPGTVFTDQMMLHEGGFEGEAVDLEHQLFVFDIDTAQPVQLLRIRDMAALLERVNRTINRNEAVYWLRYLVSWLCKFSVKAFLHAKNLQPEIRELRAQLVALVNGSLLQRLPLLVRIVVRNLSSIIGKPSLIDRLWNDTVDLAEIHVRGSAIVNEIRRSSHHALGRRTVQLAHAYLEYLESGDASGIARNGFPAPSEADIEARKQPAAMEITRRVVEDLERLLGSSETITRIQEWRETYASALVSCEFCDSIANEVETIVARGIRAGNRWVFYHHLRILARKGESFTGVDDVCGPFAKDLAALEELVPDEEGFDPGAAEKLLRDSVARFVRGLEATFQEELFRGLDDVRRLYERGEYFETFTSLYALRAKVRGMIQRGGFEEQRYLLCELDCLLEGMGYLAVRHIATGFQEKGPKLDECIEIIRLSALNLHYNSHSSRELYDLVAILGSGSRTDAEMLNALDCIERSYHKIRQKVTGPYDMLRERFGLSEEDLRGALANMQRYLHDLNSMVSFADIAATHLRQHGTRGAQRARRPSASTPDPSRQILHLSHRQEIAKLVERADGAPSLRDLYGGKGSGLLYISYLNIPTRDGFVLPTTIPRTGFHKKQQAKLQQAISEHVSILEGDIRTRTGEEKRFGDADHPLILAVRGGSVFSMPGMLSTVVFVGINDEIARGLAKDGPWHAYDSYRRFLASYAQAVWDVDLEACGLVDEAKRRHGVQYKKELPWEAMREITEASKAVLREKGLGKALDEILADPRKQLFKAVEAVFESWNRQTAQRYRAIKGLSDSWHSAAIVQEMAFGNRSNEEIRAGMDETRSSLTGVVPRTHATPRGVRGLEGEIKFSAAGDDLVGGLTPSRSFRPVQHLEELMPRLHTRLLHTIAKLRRFMGTDQEVEFTVERGVLSILQSRTAATAAEKEAFALIDPGEAAARGLGVRGGGFRGLAAFDDADRVELAEIDLDARDDVDGVMMILENPTPDDIPMILSADGLLTAKGGSTSHAAVAVNTIENRRFSAVMSADGLRVRAEEHEAAIFDSDGKRRWRIRKGDVVTIHGTTGEVFIGTRVLDTRT